MPAAGSAWAVSAATCGPVKAGPHASGAPSPRSARAMASNAVRATTDRPVRSGCSARLSRSSPNGWPSAVCASTRKRAGGRRTWRGCPTNSTVPPSTRHPSLGRIRLTAGRIRRTVGGGAPRGSAKRRWRSTSGRCGHRSGPSVSSAPRRGQPWRTSLTSWSRPGMTFVICCGRCRASSTAPTPPPRTRSESSTTTPPTRSTPAETKRPTTRNAPTGALRSPWTASGGRPGTAPPKPAPARSTRTPIAPRVEV